MRILLLALSLLGCRPQYDVYGGGELDITFGDVVTRGFSGTVHVTGATDRAALGEEPCDREGLVGSLTDHGDDPAILEIDVCGTEFNEGITESESEGTFKFQQYGDWLEGDILSDIGGAGAMDHASIRMYEPSGDSLIAFWGTWQLAAVDVTVDGLTGTLSGPMDFQEDPADFDTGSPPSEPASWTQEVTVTWAFDESIHRLKSSAPTTRHPSLIPTW
jgi:hypothetical protein